MLTRRSLFTALAGLVGAPVVALVPKPGPKPFIISNAAAAYQRALAMTVGRTQFPDECLLAFKPRAIQWISADHGQSRKDWHKPVMASHGCAQPIAKSPNPCYRPSPMGIDQLA